ncbi:MAG: winged helix-turn-helix domain-containing protein [Lysobacterales bacterium]
MSDWTFFSNYGHVLVCLSKNREARLRDVASDVGITERAVQKIVRDLQDAGYVTVTKQGRCNRYSINRRKSLRHGLESHCSVGRLLGLLTEGERKRSPASERDEPPDPATEVPEGRQPMPASPEESAPVGAPPSGSSSAEKAEKNEREEKKEKGPIDVRQQGSLF